MDKTQIDRREVMVAGAAVAAGGVTGVTAKRRMPTVYLPHGGGPCFFMPDGAMGPPGSWKPMAGYLAGINANLPSTPKALLVISAHWEAEVPTVVSSTQPPLLYDYYGFPPETYALKWPAPGSPGLATRVQTLLGAAGIASAADGVRGFDHGVFIPLKLAYPEAQIPTVQLSLRAGLDPAEHLAIGRALVPLRDDGVLIVGSGMSYHNMRGFNSGPAGLDSKRFDAWLQHVTSDAQPARDAQLTAWVKAPSARACHPREEHLLPLMVAAGAAGADRGKAVFSGEALGVQVTAVQFG
jgi:aromatic ring-opening dioxygenase catalytic subunit (LigB family)